MANYRYKTTDGWARTSNIVENFKGVDFYKDFTEVGNDIYAKAAVSMKTTIVKNVENWLNSTPIRNNLNNLTKGISKGIKWNSKTLFYEKAELHIYMKSFSSSFDTAYDFAQMSTDDDIHIVKIEENTAPIIYLIDIYNALKDEYTFDPQIELLLQNEKEYLIVAYKLFVKPKKQTKNLTNKNINIYKGEFFK